ncbi:kelch-like protein 3 [Ptychodera flava]|uniref:kelch-like protein 3 n=1 Tax=Ptychodera flava TaxID=63121 RepID=UPI003969E733
MMNIMEKSEQSDQLVQHATQVLLSMDRLRQDRVLTDYTIYVENSQVNCHKILLRICGVDFSDFCSGKEAISRRQVGKNTAINVDNIAASIVKALVNFCYTGRILITKENVQQVLQVTSLMRLTFLAEECLKFMEISQELDEIQDNLVPDQAVVCQPMHGVQVLTEFQFMKSHAENTDVSLVCQEDEFSCHSLILAACSDYFKAMFTHNFTEQKAKKIDLSEPADIVEDLVTYMYTSKFDIEDEDILELLASAAYFQVCFPPATISSIKRIVNPENCFKILDISTVFSPELRDDVLLYIFKAFPKLTDNEDFYNLPLPVLTQILSDDRLNVLAEEIVFTAACSWLNYDIDTRWCYLDELMECVRFPLLHDSFLQSISKQHPYILKSGTCKEKVEVAIKTKQVLSSSGETFSEKCRPRNSMNQDLIFVLTRAFDGSHGPRCAFLGLSDHTVHHVNATSGNLPPGLSRFTIISKDTDIFVIGGWDTDHDVACQTTWKYSITKNAWIRCADMSLARYDVAVGVMDDSIYAIGGQIGSIDVAHPVAAVEKYDIGTDQWIEVEPLPTPLTKPVVTVYKDRIFAMDAASHSKVIRTLCVYHSYTGLWGVVPAGVGLMNMRYIEHLMTMNNSILCWGLYDAEGCQLTYNAFQRFNAENFPPRRGGMLVRHPPLVSPRLQHPAKFEPVNPVGLAMNNNTVFVISDAQARRGRHLLIDRYNPYSNEWAEQIEISTPLSKGITSGLQCVVYKGYIARPWQNES